MKKILLLLFIASFAMQISAQTANSPVAIVKKIVKDVTYKKPNESDWEAAKTGMPLYDGGDVKTASKSLALVLFKDDSGLLRVKENSVLHIYGVQEGKQLSKNTVVDKGSIGFDKKKQIEGEFKFTTPTAVASIRGSIGVLEVDADSTTTLIMETGNALFSSLLGNRESREVNGGFTGRVDKDGNLTFNPSTTEDTLLLQNSKRTQVKKIKIRTNFGDIEIEYLEEEKN